MAHHLERGAEERFLHLRRARRGRSVARVVAARALRLHVEQMTDERAEQRADRSRCKHADQRLTLPDRFSPARCTIRRIMQRYVSASLPRLAILDHAAPPLADARRPCSASIRARCATSTRSTTQHMLIVTTDRLSAFDVVLPDPIPGKGRVLTQISNFWFERTAAHRAESPHRLSARTRRARCRRARAARRPQHGRASACVRCPSKPWCAAI